MKMFSALPVAAIAFAAVLTAAPALAQNAQSWVAKAGVDGNPCTISQPCATLQHAIDQTNAGGQVNVADAGEYLTAGFVTITKSIAIINEGAGDAILSSTFPGGLVFIGGSPGTVTLRGFIIDGRGVAGAGINFHPGSNGATLIIEKCVVRNSAANNLGFGLTARPDASSKIVITDSSFLNNGTSTTGAGIQILPNGSGSAEVVLERVAVAGNTFGIAADGTSSTAGINMTISDSVVSANSQDGIVATTSAGGAPMGVLIKNTRSVNNATFGVRAIGAGVSVRMSGSTVTGSSTGIAAVGGGTLLTFGNNEILGNGSDGAFSGPVALQ
jgi:hypothetical protein